MITDMIHDALGTILPVYGRTPDFGKDEPSAYAVYTLTERPAEFGDGDEHCTEYVVMLSVFTPALDFPLYRRIKAAMKAAGFGFMCGAQTGTDNLFPYVTHYHLDFVGVCDDG